MYKHETILTVMHLHYTLDPLYKWDGWMITRDDNQAFGYIGLVDNQAFGYIGLVDNQAFGYIG